jgi:2-iminobutanoate/2-iminopropanoate deaminase
MKFKRLVVVVLSGLLSLAVASPLTAQSDTPPVKQVVATASAPAAHGPYSQAIRHGDLLFLSGQMAFDPKSGSFLGNLDIEGQTHQVMDNLKAVLAANGMTMDNVLSMTVYLADMGDFAGMNKVYGEYFSKDPPARATSGATLLLKEARIEISAIAAK